MTLIAGFSKDGCPILLGDLLLSNKPKWTQKITVPTVGELSSGDISKGKYLPSGLTQKVNLLSPKLAIACTGTLFDAKNYLKEIYESGLHNNPSREALIDVYKNMDAGKDLAIICFYRNDKEMCLFDINSHKVPLPNKSFNYFKAAGIGFKGLLKTLEKSDFTSPSRSLTKLEIGLVEAMRIGSSLISEEIRTPQSLNELYGAGYEIAHPLKNEIVKFTDLVYIFRIVKEIEPGNWVMNPVPFLVMKYSYQGDILIIRSVRFSDSDQSFMANIDRDELHFINPIYNTFAKIRLTK